LKKILTNGNEKMMDFILNLVTLGLKPLYEKHLLFYTIIRDFREKLPKKQNQARKLTEKDLLKNPILAEISKMLTFIDLSSQKISLTEADIDIFYNRLNNFDYQNILFKDYYKAFTSNLNRFNPKAKDKDFDLALINDLLLETKNRPLKPFPILIYHFKYKYKLTSSIYKLMFSKKLKYPPKN